MVHSMMFWHMYTLWNYENKWINISISSCSHLSCGRSIESLLFGEFSGTNDRLLLTIVTVLCKWSLGLFPPVWDFAPLFPHSPFTPCVWPHPLQPRFCSLCLWVQLFQIPHISETMQYLSFCVWFVSLSTLFYNYLFGCWALPGDQDLL